MQRTRPPVPVPPDIDDAGRAFGTGLRVELIRHYLHHPGTQALAVDALGESSANVSRNTQVLIETRVVEVHPSPTGPRTYSVNQPRVWELAGRVATYILTGSEPPPETPRVP